HRLGKLCQTPRNQRCVPNVLPQLARAANLLNRRLSHRPANDDARRTLSEIITNGKQTTSICSASLSRIVSRNFATPHEPNPPKREITPFGHTVLKGFR